MRRYGFYYRYDTPAELAVLNELWQHVKDRLSYFMPTNKPAGWSTDRAGRRKRLYDSPAAPFRRLTASGVLSRAQLAELAARKNALNPAHLLARISELQQRLIGLAAGKARGLQEEAQARQTGRLPDPAGLKIRRPAG